ncbi:MAG: hypothetical protein KGH65_05205 [Candidatus Micrarchaeota archaeon]|nr:hypothetical protein [Candidatus Micrarchaeota archaeon]
MNEGRLANAEPSTVLARYLSNERIDAIAAEYGVTQQALSKHLLKYAKEDWQEAQVARAIARKEQAEQDLEDLRSGSYVDGKGERTTLDPVVLACARERLKSAQWDLERVCRQIYGQSPAVAIQINEYAGRPTEDLLAELRSLLGK